jgi:NTE family protein
MDLLKPRILCLCGGGIKTIAHIGALKVLEEHKLLTDINEYLGVSAGAFLSFAFAIGYSIMEMIQIMEGLDFGEIRSVDPEKLLLFDEHLGIDDGSGLVKLFNSLLKIKGLSPEVTFADLPSKKILRIFATDLSIQKPREFSRHLTPQVKVTDALRASMSLPLYFTPVRDPVTGNTLTDGGIIGNYPMIYLSDFEAQNAIGLTFDDNMSSSRPIENLQDFFRKSIECLWIEPNREIYERIVTNTIIIRCSEFTAFNFEASKEEKRDLFERGAAAARSFLASRPKPPTLTRRRSVC